MIYRPRLISSSSWGASGCEKKIEPSIVWARHFFIGGGGHFNTSTKLIVCGLDKRQNAITFLIPRRSRYLIIFNTSKTSERRREQIASRGASRAVVIFFFPSFHPSLSFENHRVRGISQARSRHSYY